MKIKVLIKAWRLEAGGRTVLSFKLEFACAGSGAYHKEIAVVELRLAHVEDMFCKIDRHVHE